MIKRIGKKLLSVPLYLENRIYRSSADLDFAKDLIEQIDKMPASRGSKYYGKINKRLGIICDRFLYDGFKNCCDLIYITPQNYEVDLPTADMLLIASTWHGLNHEWDASYKNSSSAFEALQNIKSLASKLDIPVAFYSKEDPPNFEIFKDTAKGVDVIFTSAVECIEKYKEIYPDIPCYHLPFAVNPLLHNPIGTFIKKYEKKAFFAGSFMSKYPIRIKEQQNIFDYIIDNGLELTIADRNFSRGNRNYYYPKKYRKYLVPDFEYTDIAKLYKLFPIVININSISNSDTMFAGRVYDASACGSVIISNPSVGMKRLFPYVIVINTEEDLIRVLNMSEADLDNIRLNGLRETYRLPTVYETVQFIFEKTQRCGKFIKDHSVLVIANEKTDSTISNFNSQSYKNKHIVFDKDEIDNISRYDMIAFWDSCNNYDKFYLEDMINCFKFTDCDYITADNNGKGHTYTDAYHNKSKSVFYTKSYEIKELLDMPENDLILGNGYTSNQR